MLLKLHIPCEQQRETDLQNISHRYLEDVHENRKMSFPFQKTTQKQIHMTQKSSQKVNGEMGSGLAKPLRSGRIAYKWRKMSAVCHSIKKQTALMFLEDTGDLH